MNTDTPRPSSIIKELVSDTMECPICAEVIKSKAIKCRYCGHQLTGTSNLAELVANIEIADFDKEADKRTFNSVFSTKHRSELIIILSIAFMFLSLVTPWYHADWGKNGYQGNYFIASYNLILLLLFFIYPIIRLISNKQIQFRYVIVCSLLVTLWTIRILFLNYLHSTWYLRVSVGPWLSVIASILYVAGSLFIPKSIRYKQVEVPNKDRCSS